MATSVQGHRRLRAFCTALMSTLSVICFCDQNRLYASSYNTDWSWLTPDYGDTCLVVESMCTSDLTSVRLRPCTLNQDTVWQYDSDTKNYECGSSSDCALDMFYAENGAHACPYCAGKENCKWDAPDLEGGSFELQSQFGDKLCLVVDADSSTSIAIAACTESTFWTWMPQNASLISFAPSSSIKLGIGMILAISLPFPIFLACLLFCLCCSPRQMIRDYMETRRTTQAQQQTPTQQSILEEKERKKEEGEKEIAPAPVQKI